MQMLGSKDGESVSQQPKTARPNEQDINDIESDIPF
jgi:hypothetical protein